MGLRGGERGLSYLFLGDPALSLLGDLLGERSTGLFTSGLLPRAAYGDLERRLIGDLARSFLGENRLGGGGGERALSGNSSVLPRTGGLLDRLRYGGGDRLRFR